MAYSYAWQVYSGMKTARRLKDLAKTVFSVDGNATQAFVKTYSNVWSAGSAWALQSGWFWKGTGSSDFNFASPEENSDWVRQSTVTERNANGFKTAANDALATPSLTIYDANGFWPLAKLKSGATGAVMGFQSYEDAGDWQLAGNAAIQAGDAHTGSRCVHLPTGGSLQNTALTADSGQYVFSCWVKGSDVDAAWRLTAGSATATLGVPQSDVWQYIFTFISVDKDGSAASAALANTGSGELMVDDIRFCPVACRFSVTVYDESTRYPCARLGPNGETMRVFYDERLRLIGSTGADDGMATLHSRHYSDAGLKMFDDTVNDPGSILAMRSRNGGPWDDFRDNNWQNRWSGDANAWQVSDQALVHQGSSQDSVDLIGSEQYCNYAVQVSVSCPDSQKLTGKLGLKIGSGLSVQWNPDQSRWELLVGTTLQDQFSGGLEDVMHWLVIAGEHGVVFCLNDRQVLSYAAESKATAISGALSLFAGDAGVGFSQVLVALQPLTHMVYRDGTGRPVQIQQLADNQVIARQALFDELGRSTIHTKPVSYDQTILGYRSGLVTGFDSSTGEMSGDVSNYYNGEDGRSNDEGYPYSRQRIEDSGLSRVQELGRPGKAFAIGADGSHTVSYRYGVNGGNPFYGTSANGQYKVRIQSDADGLATATVNDLIGNRLARVSGESGFPLGSIYSSCELDPQDNRAVIRTPNHFAPPSGTAEDWLVKRNFDYRNRLLDSSSADAGQTQTLHDTLGRLRFSLIADGCGTGSQNPCQGLSETPVTILYRCYDALGRVTEQGNYCVASWDDAAQHVDDPSWPSDAVNWRYRYSYDGDGSEQYTIGRLIEVHTNNGSQGEIVESFSHDIFGHTTGYTLHQGSDSTTFIYHYDNQGHLLRIDYPALGELAAQSVTYSHDARCLLASIGTPDEADAYATYTRNAAGQITVATLGKGAEAITRQFAYHCRGWLKSCEDDFSSETLYYEDSNPDGTNTVRYNGLISALEYTRQDGTDFSWTYLYDTFGRMQSVSRADGFARQYSYDPNGNLTKVETTGEPVTFTYDGSNFLLTAGNRSYTARPSGEVATGGDMGMSYDFTSRLITAVDLTSSGQSLSMQYGAGVQRLSKTLKGSAGQTLSCRRYYPGLHKRALLEQFGDTSPGQAIRYIYGPGGILAMQTAGSTYYVLQDHQRSNRLMVTGADSDPAAVFDYLPYGQAMGDAGGSDPDLLIYRYTGQEWDPETELYNYRHRLYDPAISRFLSPDPKRQYFSPYIYAGDRPLQSIDPSGEFSLFGTIVSSAEIVVGAAMVGTGVLAPLGGMMIGAGAAGLNYSLRAKHFNSSQYFQVETAAAVSTGEIEAGVALTVVSAGAAYNVGGGTLMGAGIGGLSNTFMQINMNPNGNFSWGQWGIAEGIGAAVGTVAGGIGAAIGAGGEAAAGVAASGVANVAGDDSAVAAVDAASASSGLGAGSGGAAGLVEDTAGAVADAGGAGGDVGSGGANGMVMDTAQGPVDPGGGGPAAEPAPNAAARPAVPEGIQGGPDAPAPPAAGGGGGGGAGGYGVVDTAGDGEPAPEVRAPARPAAQNYGVEGHVDVTGEGVDVPDDPNMPVSNPWARLIETDYI